MSGRRSGKRRHPTTKAVEAGTSAKKSRTVEPVANPGYQSESPDAVVEGPFAVPKSGSGVIKMAITAGNELFVRITLLTFEGGVWICKKILNREVERKSGVSALDALLPTKEKLMQKRKDITKKQLKILFPSSGATTNVDNWDLSLLVKMIITLFRRSLSKLERSNLNKIMRIRNEVICHTSEPSIGQQKFFSEWTQLTASINILASSFDADTVQYSSELIQKFAIGPIDLQTSIEKLSKLCRNDELMDNILASLARIENAVAKGMTSANHKLDEVLAILKAIKNTELAKLAEEIPVFNAKVFIGGEDKEVVKIAESILLKVMRCAREKINDPDDYEKLKRAVEQILADLDGKGAVVVSTGRGSIILNIKCNNLTGLENFMNLFRIDGQSYRLEGIEGALSELLQDELIVNLLLPSDTIERISDWIDACMSGKTSSSSEDTEYKGTLNMGIKCKSVNSAIQVIDYFQSGEAANRINQLSEIFSTSHGETIRMDVALDLEEFNQALRHHLQAGKSSMTGTEYDIIRMATTQARFADKRYPNWITTSLSLLYLKQGIEVIIDTEAKVFHNILQKAWADINEGPQACSSSCASKPVIKNKYHEQWCMKYQLYNAWLPEINNYHIKNNLSESSLQNTDPLRWPTEPYEVLKCFMPYGCQKDQSVKDGDVQGLLRLIQNCSHFTNCGKISQKSQSLINKVLEIGNYLFHSGDFLVDDGKLGNYLDTMLEFLEETSLLTILSDPEKTSVDGAITKIKELRDGILDLSLNKEAELIAIQQKQSALDRDLKTLKESDVNTRKELQEVKDKFYKFLEDNDLANDLAKMSKSIQQQEKRTTDLENLTQAHDSTLEAHSSKMQAHASTLEAHSSKMEAHDSEIRGQKRKKHALSTVIRAENRKRHAFAKTQQAHFSKLQDLEDRQDQMEIESQQRNQEVQPEEITENDISNLRAFLRDQYRATDLSVPNPVVPEDHELDRVYVDPDIKVLWEKYPESGPVNDQDQLVPANVSQCRRLFYTKDYRCKNIYICGDAGTGKSTFCKHLVNTWCKAHGEESESEDSDSEDYSDSGRGGHQRESSKTKRQSDKKKDRRIMSEFDLLFYIKLRDSSNMYHISEMIDFQILQKDEDRIHLKASVLLEKVCCLVIVDGLDEWVCPENANVPHFVNSGIPGRNRSNKNATFLTTTRPWKFHAIQLEISEVDKHAVLAGFKHTSSKQLCSKIIKLRNKSENKQRTKQEFWDELERKDLAHLINVPIILTELVFLWFDEKNFGQSKVQLYCRILEMLLKRPDKASQPCTAAQKTEPTVELLPECFSNSPYCHAHQQLLFSLSKLAFEALFDKKRENALVFESSQKEIYNVDEKGIDSCLKSGILSLNEVLGKWSVRAKKMSFLHKKLQEFLAALFMVNGENAEIVALRIKTFCTSVDTMLEMSQVWMFVSGIRPATYKQLLKELLTDVVFIDRRLQEERQTVTDPWPALALQRSIQTCIAGCEEEARSNGHSDLRLPLHDFVIDNDTISECLENLFTSNLESVKSVYIDTRGMTGQAVGRIVGQLQDTRLQKLYLYDLGSVISDVGKTLGKTLTANKRHLTCLQLRHISLTGETPADVWDVVTNLTGLDLLRVRMTHERREQLLLSVSRAAAMRQLRLEEVRCTDHGVGCETVLDLSGCTQLHKLHLTDMYIAKMAAVTNCVERVRLSKVTIPGRQLELFVRELSSASRPLMVELLSVTVTGASGSPVGLTYLRHTDNVEVTWWDYDAGNFISEVIFKTRQQMTSDPGNQPQTSTPSV